MIGQRTKCLAAYTFAAISIFLSSTALAAGSPPNVVMIVGDDIGWMDYGFMSHDVVKTPYLDQLASEGALFPNGDERLVSRTRSYFHYQ